MKFSDEYEPELISNDLERLIENCIEHFQFNDAVVLGEAYYSRVRSEEALYLLAKCFVLQGKFETAYSTLKNGLFDSERCRFLMAKCAFELNRLDEVESLLQSETCCTSSLPFVHNLLAKTLREIGRSDQSVKNYFKMSIESGSFLWSSIKGYCDSGGEDVGKMCAKSMLEIQNLEQELSFNGNNKCTRDRFSKSRKVSISSAQQLATNRKRAQVQTLVPKKKATGMSPNNLINVNVRRRIPITETSVETRRSLRLFSAQEDENRIQYNRGKNNNTRLKSRSPVIPRKLNFDETDEEADEELILKQKEAMHHHLRRAISRTTQPLSSVNNSTNIENEKNKKKSVTGVANAPVDEIYIQEEDENETTTGGELVEEDEETIMEGEEEPMDLENADPSSQQKFIAVGGVYVKAEKKRDKVYGDISKWISQLAQAQEQLSRFRCLEALNVLDLIDIAFSKLPLSLEIRARIFFECGEYSRCCDVCEEIRQLYPRRHQGMEIYSTSLWQLQDSHKLSALCSEMVSIARDEPEAWCVAGNSFSLEKQHETAVECLERAIRLNSKFGYAYSLLGHELIILNDLNRASQAFRRAIICMPNDYRPWYGLGLVHYKEEQLQLAKVNLVKAVQINPTNIIVLCQLSVIEQSLQNNKGAMECLDRALGFAPNNVACLYHKARLLFDVGRYTESLEELNKLKSLSPDEAHVFYLLGRVYRKLGDYHMALLSYSWATEIDPRGDQNHSALSDQGPYDDDPVDFNETINNVSDTSSLY